MTDYPVSSGQTVTGLQLPSGDTQTVSSGGLIINTYAGGPLSEYTNNPPNTTVPGVPPGFYSGAGGEVILDGGHSTGTALNDGTESIYAGGVSNNTTVGTVLVVSSYNGNGNTQGLPGSAQNIHSGGVANNSLVMNGTQTVMSGGVSNNATLVNGIEELGLIGSTIVFDASQLVLSGGTANATFLTGGSSTIAAGGTASATTIGYLGSQSVSGTATATIINTGGVENIASGGVAVSTTVNGAAPFTYAANPHYYFELTSVAGGLNIQAGGMASGTTVENGGNLDDLGTVSATMLIGSNSMLVVEKTGYAAFTTIGSGAAEIVSGVENEVHVAQGGSLSVLGGGLIEGATIDSGATVSVASGGALTALVLGINDNGVINTAGSINLPAVRGSGASVLDVGSTGTLNNSGVIDAGAGTRQSIGASAAPASVAVESGGHLVNTGTITIEATPVATPTLAPAPASMSVAAAGVLVNAGTLNATGSVSVAGTLVLDPGQVTTGIVQGNASATLELAAGSAGTLAGLGSTYAGFGIVMVDAGANWTFAGSNTLSEGATLQLGDSSTLTVANGTLMDAAAGVINFQSNSTLSIGSAPTGLVLTNFGICNTVDVTGLAPGNDELLDFGNTVGVSVYGGGGNSLISPITFAGEGSRHFALRTLTATSVALTLEPVITALAAHPNVTGPLGSGNIVTFDLTPEAALSVNTTTGLPVLTLNDGGTAAYDQTASTSTNLVFRTTIAVGDYTPDLKVTGLLPGGATIMDQFGTTLDLASVPVLAGSDTGLAVAGSAPVTTTPTTPTPPTTVTGGVTVIGGAGGTVFITPKAGSNSVTATATGNDTVISQGSDTIQAGGGADVVYATGATAIVAGGTGSLTFEGGSGNYMVVGGSGSSAIYGGSGSDTFFGGSGSSILVAGSGANNVLLAGVGNTSLVGGLGKAVMMFGGPGTDSFTGSSGGNDIMVGGAGGNSFSLTGGDVAFGGPLRADTFTAGNGTAMITTGSGGAQVNLGSGTLTSFEGSGAVNYNAGKGEGGTTDIVGFTSHDHITLTDGFTAQDASTAFSTATKGSFGTTLNLTDGTKITVFGVNLTTTQVSVG